MTTHPIASFLRQRRRALVSGLAGLAAGVLVSRAGLLPGVSSLIGWNVAALLFVSATFPMLWWDDEANVRARAAREDESREVMMVLVLVAVGASLGAVVYALRETKGHAGAPGKDPMLLLLCFSTLVLSWLTVQSLFTLHYAHRYFGDSDKDNKIDGGVTFPGDPPRTYRDFIYMAVCVGCTCQVSDFDITTMRFRNLVTAHAVVAFVFNTMVLALGINIVGGLMG